MAKKSTSKKTKEESKPAAKTKTASATKAKAKKQEAKPKVAASKATAKPKKPVHTDLTPVITIKHNDVAAKAYEIWLAKGRPIGQDEQNWLEAEAALAKKK